MRGTSVISDSLMIIERSVTRRRFISSTSLLFDDSIFVLPHAFQRSFNSLLEQHSQLCHAQMSGTAGHIACASRLYLHDRQAFTLWRCILVKSNRIDRCSVTTDAGRTGSYLPPKLPALSCRNADCRWEQLSSAGKVHFRLLAQQHSHISVWDRS